MSFLLKPQTPCGLCSDSSFFCGESTLFLQSKVKLEGGLWRRGWQVSGWRDFMPVSNGSVSISIFLWQCMCVCMCMYRSVFEINQWIVPVADSLELIWQWNHYSLDTDAHSPCEITSSRANRSRCQYIYILLNMAVTTSEKYTQGLELIKKIRGCILFASIDKTKFGK